MNKLERFVLKEMIDSLPDFKGVRVCSLRNLAFVLLESDYCYFKNPKSVEEIRAWINEYFMYFWEVVDDYENEYGCYPYGNIFLAPERFQSNIMFYMARRLAPLSKYVANHNEGFIINDEAINTITEEWQDALLCE